MAKIESFRDLKTYQRARIEAGRVFQLSHGFPTEERYSLTDQMRRSSRAVGAMISEAWARRRYEAVFVSKISEALGEATETQAWLDHALDSGYIDETTHATAEAAWSEVGAMLQGMIDRSESFCPKS